MTRWIRRTLRRYGIDLPFTAVICPQYVKAIRIDTDARVDVTVERTLVFLQEPEPRDLRDYVPLAADEGTIHESPDAQDLLRTATPKGTIVYWTPRTPIVPCALYVHQRAWSAPGAPGDAALYTGFHCEVRTGTAIVELSTPGAVEAAVAFRWPRWRQVQSVQGMVKHALRQLDAAEGERPEILDDGARIRWTFTGLRAGERYACVAFHENGVALWRQRLEADAIPARLRRLVKAVTSF
jgi:hypothetical protein